MIRQLCKLMIGLVIVACVAFGYFIYQTYDQVVNPLEIEQTITNIQAQENYVQVEDIAPVFLDAMVAIEDRRFYQHHGFEIRSIVRALVKNIESGEVVQGGSTITQQLAKNVFLTHDQTLTRKLSEMVLAFELDRLYEKDEILELYVNVIYYGDGHTGIYEASTGYFDVAPSELTYDQATLLAGLPQAPSYYALSQNRDRAEIRQEQVISALKDYTEANAY